MVIRILTGKAVAGAVRYNEQKVEQGQAKRIQIANYPDRQVAEKYGQFRLQLLEQLTRLNPAVAKPSVHLAIAFHPSESMTNDQLRQIGGEVMTEAGYGRQPYLMYRHDDTEHPHIHIVSVSVDANGHKISDKFIKNRLNKIRKDVEQKHGLLRAEQGLHEQEIDKATEGEAVRNETYQPTIGKMIQQALEMFTFGSVESFRQYMLLQNVVMKETAGRSRTGVTFQAREKSETLTRPVRASSLMGKPTNKRLAELFAAQAERHRKGCETMATVIGQRVSRYECLTESEFKTTLQQIGIQVSDRGGVYLYVQERAGLVAQESEIGMAFCRQTVQTHFAESTARKQTRVEETANQQQINQIEGQTFHSTSLADSDLARTLTVQEPGQQQLPQAMPQSTAPQEIAITTTDEKKVETAAHPLKEGRGEDKQNVSLIKKPKKLKKNLRRKGPRL